MKSLFMVITLIFGLVFLQVQAFAALPSAQRENPHVVAGRNDIAAKDFKTAVGDLEKALQEDPKDADAHTMLAYSYRKLGVFGKSMDHYQKALKIDPNHRSTHEYLGKLYLDINQPGIAERQLQTLKKTCPFFGKCSEYNDLKQAIDNYKAKNSRSPRSSKFYRRNHESESTEQTNA